MLHFRSFLIAFFLFLLFLACPKTTEIIELAPPDLLSPADGDTITTNPPVFVWSPVEGDSCDLVYRIEIASNQDFNINATIVSTMVPLPETTFTPTDTFACGTYYWHMSVRQNA